MRDVNLMLQILTDTAQVPRGRKNVDTGVNSIMSHQLELLSDLSLVSDLTITENGKDFDASWRISSKGYDLLSALGNEGQKTLKRLVNDGVSLGYLIEKVLRREHKDFINGGTNGERNDQAC